MTRVQEEKGARGAPARPLRRWAAVTAVSVLGGCDGIASGCTPDLGPIKLFLFCPQGQPGTASGMPEQGRVEVTADEAWPKRPAVEARPPPQQVALACLAYMSCPETQQPRMDFNLPMLGACLSGGLAWLGGNRAERVIPLAGYNESWEFFVREAAAASADCSALRALLTPADPGVVCGEEGCYRNDSAEPTVTCEGDRATLETGSGAIERDCSRSGMVCDAESVTGCTDRMLTGCAGGLERCDGDILLGCDECDFVSYYDCRWNGGHCEETEDGARCVPPEPASGCESLPTTCDGNTVWLCVFDQPVAVDCAAAGLGVCEETGAQPASRLPRTHCVRQPVSGAADAGLPQDAANSPRDAAREQGPGVQSSRDATADGAIPDASTRAADGLP